MHALGVPVLLILFPPLAGPLQSLGRFLEDLTTRLEAQSARLSEERERTFVRGGEPRGLGARLAVAPVTQPRVQLQCLGLVVQRIMTKAATAVQASQVEAAFRDLLVTGSLVERDGLAIILRQPQLTV